MEDELLPVLLKLVQGNKELCFELIEAVREQHPDKSMHWCIKKAIYDARFPKKQVQPNPKLARWGTSGGSYQATAKPPSQPVSTPVATVKPLPPVPPPNPTLSKPQQTDLTISLSKLEALAKAKQKKIAAKPASGATKQRLDSLTKDRRVSDRLVHRLLLQNPGRSEQWAYEKAIYDLERDRL